MTMSIVSPPAPNWPVRTLIGYEWLLVRKLDGHGGGRNLRPWSDCGPERLVLPGSVRLGSFGRVLAGGVGSSRRLACHRRRVDACDRGDMGSRFRRMRSIEDRARRSFREPTIVVLALVGSLQMS